MAAKLPIVGACNTAVLFWHSGNTRFHNHCDPHCVSILTKTLEK